MLPELYKENWPSRLTDQFDNFFKDTFFSEPIKLYSAVNAYSRKVEKTEDGYEITALCAGVDKKDLSIEIKGNVLCVQNENHTEYSFDEFKYNIDIVKLDVSKLKASLDKGILKISIPFAEEVKKENEVVKVEID